MSQPDGWNCGFASIANAVAFVRHFEKTKFVSSNFRCVSNNPRDMRYVADGEKLNLSIFWKNLDVKANESKKYKMTGFRFSDILHLLRMEFYTLCRQFSKMIAGNLERELSGDGGEKENVVEISDTESENEHSATIQILDPFTHAQNMNDSIEQKKQLLERKVVWLNKRLEKKGISDGERIKLEWQRGTVDALKVHILKESMTAEEYAEF